ncbi:TetR family transcriptional regulator [Streptomyces nanshensis]|nr:TetR family transcriptional regulator [Streptomyces nanshensis]
MPGPSTTPSSTGSEQPASRSRRDPQARRRAIIQAAADLLIEEGGGNITHRRVAERAEVPLGATTYYFKTLDELREAGLELLADEVEEVLGDVRREAAEAEGDPEVLARLLHDYLADRESVRADTALYCAAIQRPELRPLAMRWFDGMVELLSDWTDPATARLVATFADGVSLHATVHDEPLSLADLTRVFTALMRPHPTEEEK